MLRRVSTPSHRVFVPRIALLLVAGFVLCGASMLVYVLPTLNEPAPPGAIASWHAERVKTRLRGKVHWFFAGSMLAVGLVGWRWLAPDERA